MAGDLFTLTPDELIVTHKIREMLKNVVAEENLALLLTESATKPLTRIERNTFLPKIRKQIKKIALEKPKESLIAYIKTLPLHTVIALAHNYEEFEIFCKRDELKDHWEKLIPEQGLSISPNFRWRVQNNGNHPFNQLRANYFFNASLEQASNPPLLKRYNQEAAKLGCFYAQYKEMPALIIEFYTNVNNTSLRDTIIAKALETVRLHEMPGFILLASIFISIASAYQTNFSRTNDSTYKRTAELHFDLAATSIEAAKTLEHAKESETPLYNAGLGCSFFECFKALHNNCEDYSSLQSMETHLNVIRSREETRRFTFLPPTASLKRILGMDDHTCTETAYPCSRI